MVADLAEQGWDVPALYRARRWAFLADLVDGLGPTSRVVTAMVNDEERAEQIAEAAMGLQDAEPSSLRDQTPEAVALRAIFNLLVRALGGKETWPEPVTAVDRAKDRLVSEEAADIISVMTPWALA